MSKVRVHQFRGCVLLAALFLVVTACANEGNAPTEGQNYASGAGMGYAGIAGMAGMAGAAGMAGMAGAAGMAGGIAGMAGMAGAAGMAGMAGAAGAAGMAGMAGEAGMAGMAGTAGSGGDAGTAGMAGTGGMGGAGTGGTGGTNPPGDLIFPDRCTGNGNSVAMIGDSYWALSGEIYMFLQQYSGQNYRPYYVSATVISQIKGQADIAYAAAPTQALLMDGGGNDALLNTNCTVGGLSNATCKSDVDTALGVLDTLLQTAEDNGVEEVVFFYYPYIVTFASLLNPVNDYARPIARQKCESRTRLKCTFIDTIPTFEGHSEYIGFDGIHPSRSGSEAIAKLIWAVMEDNCANGISVTP